MIKNYTSNPENYNYDFDYKSSIENPIEFWNEVATKYVYWDKIYDNVLGGTDENPLWFENGKLNLCYNAVDKQALDPITKNKFALIHENPLYNIITKITYSELYDKVCEFSTALKSLGLVKGQRVMLYMPMINQGAIAMLSCARLGLIHSNVYGGLPAYQFAARINLFKPHVIVSSNFGTYSLTNTPFFKILNQALSLTKVVPDHVIIYNRKDYILSQPDSPPAGSLDWEELVKETTKNGTCIDRGYTMVDSNDPLCVLFTSGTTGEPKGILRTTGGYVVNLNYQFKAFQGVHVGQDTIFSKSDYGWISGHSCMTYAALLCGLSSIIFEGDPVLPDPGTLWAIVERNKVNILNIGTVVGVLTKEDPKGEYIKKYDLSSLRQIWASGDKISESRYTFMKENTGAHIDFMEGYGNTECGWLIVGNCYNADYIKPGITGKPYPGYTIHLLDEHSNQVKQGDIGELAIKLPVIPGFATSLYSDQNSRYEKSYLQRHKGYMNTGDIAHQLPEGHINIVSRLDDMSKCNGVSIFLGKIEEVLLTHQAIADCMVTVVKNKLTREYTLGVIVLKTDHLSQPIDSLQKETCQMVLDKLGKIEAFKGVIIVDSLLKNRSGKIIRNLITSIINDEPISQEISIEDQIIVKQIKDGIFKFKQINQ